MFLYLITDTNKKLNKRENCSYFGSLFGSKVSKMCTHIFENSSLQQIMEARYSKQTYSTNEKSSRHPERFRTDRRSYGFKTVLTYDQREIRGQLAQ